MCLDGFLQRSFETLCKSVFWLSGWMIALWCTIHSHKVVFSVSVRCCWETWDCLAGTEWPSQQLWRVPCLTPKSQLQGKHSWCGLHGDS
jgi:hypothetical protein